MGAEIRNDHSQEAIDTIHKKILEALELCGQVAEGYAQVNLTEQHAVDTGLLRNSITYAIAGGSAAIGSYKCDPGKGNKSGSYSGKAPGKEDDLKVYIGTNVEYAPYIELGTGRETKGGRRTKWTYKKDNGETKTTNGSAARPYLKPAVTDHKDEYKKLLDDALRV